MRRPGTLDWKFPLVMSGAILATTALFVWAAYAQFTSALYESIGERLRSGAAVVVPLVAPPASRQVRAAALVADPDVRALLEGDRSRRAAAAAALARAFDLPADSLHFGYALLSADGVPLVERRARAFAPPRWAGAREPLDSLRRAAQRHSPLVDAGGIPMFEVVDAVVALADVRARDRTIGYVVEWRALLGRGGEAIRGLAGGGAFLVGAPGEGVWTDLERILPGPPPIPRVDSVLVFGDSPRGAGIGVAAAVPRTPWVVWLQSPREAATGPVRTFIWRIAPVAAAIALLGALLAWLLSRQITSRLVALTHSVDRLEAGQGQPPTPEQPGEDEIDRLERAFDRMAARVEQQQRLEQQLMQSQKIEAVGRLAGGIAHDFNNVITVVRNYSELVRAELAPESEVATDMDEVLRATDRASALTRQLLAFSRQQAVAPQVVDLNAVILGAQRMLTRVIPSHVVFETQLDPGPVRISVDPGQLEQVLLNLTINAADAMPDGGTLTLRTDLIGRDEAFTDATGVPVRGPFVRLSVTDTGAGMDRETRERVFEPFFTTKPVGKGTGLGLATVYGIVRQAGGRVTVESEPGEGATFRLVFPAAEEPATPMPAVPAEPPQVQGPADAAPPRGTILVVEDEPATRLVTRRLLERRGFRVLEAEHGAAALAALGSGPVAVDLVLTDVMMPGISGVELSARIAERWPRLPVVLMTGYADVEVRAKGGLGPERPLVEKPFTASRLLAAVEAALPPTG